ncbi:hypothetical protein J6I75_04785 [Pseudidiomarina sp. 1APP75-27a]|uniref:hypothetical protein n=1 Tax=Pseudidiomarina terrestris TaxID=2820060 RepID=UPI002B05F339|nr:hypothetical protein [Pseudidiomarina sp. 1APP75-27a]MEA3587660.1 hypothetical protein [Pseudidiomarina sp. 1APP75-27a]
MSRWLEAFQNHPFQSKWKQICNKAQDLKADDATISTDVQEIARLKKVIRYLNELIESCDPELVPQQTWQNFDGQANVCLQQMNSYESTRNIRHLKAANEHTDNLLSYIRPYQVVASVEAKAAKNAYREYSKLVNSQQHSYKEEASSLLKRMKNMETETHDILNRSTDFFQEIKTFQEQCFEGDDQGQSIKAQIITLLTKVQNAHSNIIILRKELLEGDANEPSLALEVKEARDIAVEQSEEITVRLSKTEQELKQLLSFHDRIFGEPSEDGARTGGLKDEIEKRIMDLDNFKKEQKQKYDELNNEINSLIPGATTTGLATAYHELKKEFNDPIEKYTKYFYLSIAAIVIIALFTVVQKVGWLYIEFIDLTEISKITNNFVNRLPLYIPLVWLAMFSSKRRSEAQRLQQEYAHKEALAKSYQSFKMQIEQLQAQDDELMKKLLNAAIDALARNASDTLDNKHGDKTPIHDCLSQVSKLGNKG